MEAPFIETYEQLVQAINDLGVDTYSASQEIPKHLPVCRVQLLNGDSTNAYQDAREYSYPFQLDIVTAQNKLVQGLKLAYRVMQACRTLSVPDYACVLNDEPSLSSMVDTSTNQVLNRQIIRVTYKIIEATTF